MATASPLEAHRPSDGRVPDTRIAVVSLEHCFGGYKTEAVPHLWYWVGSQTLASEIHPVLANHGASSHPVASSTPKRPAEIDALLQLVASFLPFSQHSQSEALRMSTQADWTCAHVPSSSRISSDEIPPPAPHLSRANFVLGVSGPPPHAAIFTQRRCCPTRSTVVQALAERSLVCPLLVFPFGHTRGQSDVTRWWK